MLVQASTPALEEALLVDDLMMLDPRGGVAAVGGSTEMNHLRCGLVDYVHSGLSHSERKVRVFIERRGVELVEPTQLTK